MKNVQCEDCKFASWDMQLFATAGADHHYTEQFDLYCQKHNKFLLEQEAYGDCPDGMSGENNYHDVCLEYYRLRNKYLEMLKKFRKELDERPFDENWVFIDRNSYEEYELWTSYLKKNDLELYNKFHNETI